MSALRKTPDIIRDIEEIFLTALSSGAAPRALMVAQEVLTGLERGLLGATPARRELIIERMQRLGIGLAEVAYDLDHVVVARTTVGKLREIAVRLLLSDQKDLSAGGRVVADAIASRCSMSVGESEGFGSFYCSEIFVPQYGAILQNLPFDHPEFQPSFLVWRGTVINLIRSGNHEAGARALTVVGGLILSALRQPEPTRSKALGFVLANSHKIMRVAFEPLLTYSAIPEVTRPPAEGVRLARHAIICFSTIPMPAAQIGYSEIVIDYLQLSRDAAAASRDIADGSRNLFVSFYADLIAARKTHPKAIEDKVVDLARDLLDSVLRDSEVLMQLQNLQLLVRPLEAAARDEDEYAYSQLVLVLEKLYQNIPASQTESYKVAVHLILALAAFLQLSGKDSWLPFLFKHVIPPAGFTIHADIVAEIVRDFFRFETDNQTVSKTLKELLKT